MLAVAELGDHARRRDAERPTRASAARAGARSSLLAARRRQKRNEWPACACTASATLSSAVKSRNSDVIWNERAEPEHRCAR